MKIFKAICLGMLLSLFIVACGSARRNEPIRAPIQTDTPALQTGIKVFMKRCHQCHPGGEGGLGPAINNKPLPESLMKYQVRHGIGSMPSFSEGTISDQDLDDLMQYVVALRKNKGK